MQSRILILLILTGFMFGCDFLEETFNSIDTSKIMAQPADIESSIEWKGYNNTKDATARIDKVMFECVKNYNANDSTKSKRREFDIALTATISYNINNKYLSPYQSYVIFEALSNNGVVLGSTKGAAKLINNSTKASVSAKILGLSPGEMKKVTTIIARWDFGE